MELLAGVKMRAAVRHDGPAPTDAAPMTRAG
jgi:hypothetical protein